MIDSHAHLDDEKYSQDREEIIARAFASGIEKIINVGADLMGSQASVKLATENENIFVAVGLHPHCFNQVEEFSISKTFNNLKNLAKQEKVVAIGEIGLDYFSHDGNPITAAQKEKQKNGFVLQIEIAKKFNLPVVIHCRGSRENPNDAYIDLLQIIQDTKYPPRLAETTARQREAGQIQNTKFIFHCYGGDLAFTQKLLSMDNVSFSFTGNITYAKQDSEAVAVVREIPLEKIMLETDCPYLTPIPHRGKRNEPAYVSIVCEKIAEIKQISVNKVDEITTQNAKEFFNLA
ncbi:MAG: Hydrolase, TatD family [Candidatus Moranbacteria bacterium GW2011_GWA2_39_41]|nr:MAG: Hydrolase, TatD family [Candidatus Moranbacteria bacterium GW2011_GWA2_39_41]